jgi:hypothetical protein
MEKNMSGIRPQALSNKELLSAAYIMFEPDKGMPLDFQKEVIRRLAAFVEKYPVHQTDYKKSPDQMPLFD